MTELKAIGLFTLMVSDSQFSRDLNATLNQNGQTPDKVFQAFVKLAVPFGITAGELDRAKLELLWLQGGVLQPQFDNTADSVGDALSPPLVYSPGPCPDGTLQASLMNKLP
jgi:hypothetical protein